jgi:hypothetical protein
MDKYEMIEQIITKYMEVNTDPVALQNARNYLSEQSEYEVQETYNEVVVYAAKRNAFREGQVLKIYKHSNLINDTYNDAALNALLPGALLNYEAFVSVIRQNPLIKAKFHWLNSEPFPELAAREQEFQAGASANELNFRNACRTLAIAGTANISPNEANYSLCRAKFGEQFPSMAKMIEVLSSGAVPGLSPNAPATIDVWIKESGTQERQKLCHYLADASAYDEDTRSDVFRRLYQSTYTSNEALQERVNQIQERRRLAKMTVEEIKEENAKKRASQAHTESRVLPPEISRAHILSASAEQLKTWTSFWGKDLINQRLAGQS